MDIVGVIPARYASSRFPGKPLADICGKPMIWWVYQQAVKVKDYTAIYVATDDERIVDVCCEYDMNVIMTSSQHPTGTDRVAEVAEHITADWYVIIMGDEPLITFEDEKKLIGTIHENRSEIDAYMLVEPFVDPVDVINMTTIKLAINDEGYLIFMSRAAIPYPKESLGYSMFKNVGCYAMKKSTLDFFRHTQPGNIERAEGIELLRLLENHKKILTVKTCSDSMSVDTPKDLRRVENLLKTRQADEMKRKRGMLI